MKQTGIKETLRLYNHHKEAGQWERNSRIIAGQQLLTCGQRRDGSHADGLG